MSDIGTSSFSTFGELLKYLRRRAQLTQRELAIAVGYTEGHISRLEKNLRLPDVATVAALFVPALGLEEESETAAQLMRLAAGTHADQRAKGENFSVSRVQETTEISEGSESIPSNLPLQLTTFIGRQAEIGELKELLSRPDPARLVTLTGPGGIGKTRLAIQTAIGLSHSYPDGIWFVDLSPLSAPELIPQTIASALSAAEIRPQTVEEDLISYLRTRQVLILIDNCEHLMQAAAQVIEKILRACADVQILATSRERLHLPGEESFLVPPLSMPEDPDDAGQTVMAHEAVQLFVERARNLQRSSALSESNAALIARICRHLDGMPLAIELAAARSSLLSLSQIEARLKDRFQLLTGGYATLPRHQNLRATIAWSHDLLTEAEKTLFRRLAVFAGGWTLESASYVCANGAHDVLDLLAGLVDKSLVVVESALDSDPRYTMLETIREYAGEQLREADEREVMRSRHFDYFLQMAEEGEPRLFAVESFIDWAERELDNLRAALTWALEMDPEGTSSQERTGRGLELMLHVWPLWLYRGYSTEGNERLDKLLSIHTAESPARARALLLAGDFARYRGDSMARKESFQESLDIARKLGDQKRIGWALMEMGLVERDAQHNPEAISLLRESVEIFQGLNDTLWVCRTTFVLAETHIVNGDLEAAHPLLQAGLELCRSESDNWQMAWGLEALGNVKRLEGDLRQAGELYKESLQLKASVSDRAGITYSLEAFAQLAAADQQFERAARLWGAAEQLRRSLTMQRMHSKEELYISSVPAARRQMGDEAFKAAWAEGKKMKMHDAISYALSLPDE